MIKGTDFTGISVVFFCHDGKGKYLCQKRSTNARDEHGRWDVGGGGLKFGENIQDAVRREVFEEYGVEPQALEFLGFRELHREHDGKPTHWITFDFKVLIDSASVRIGDPFKMEELAWFMFDTLPEPPHSQLPHAANKYKDRLH